MSKVAVVGGGAAGMFASIFAAKSGNEVHVFEKNEKLGKKLFITGKGRCNVTNAADIETLLANVRANPKFLYSAFYGCSNDMVMDFFEKESYVSTIGMIGHSYGGFYTLHTAALDERVKAAICNSYFCNFNNWNN